MSFQEKYGEVAYASIQDELNFLGRNIVNCGKCGEIFGHKFEENELTCPFCKYTDDITFFPDVFY